MIRGAPSLFEYDFDQSIGYLVCKTWQALEAALNEELRAENITYRQWQVLVCLALLGEETSQGDIAERLSIERATLVGVLDRMERDGWIRRVPCPTDRRKNWIRATEQVKPVWEKMVQCARSVRAKAVEGISERDIKTTWKALERIQKNLQATTPCKMESQHVADEI